MLQFLTVDFYYFIAKLFHSQINEHLLAEEDRWGCIVLTTKDFLTRGWNKGQGGWSKSVVVLTSRAGWLRVKWEGKVHLGLE